MEPFVDRRRFLRGALNSSVETVLRPPGADAARFDSLCHDCSICVDACPQDIIRLDGNGRAILDFRAGDCTFCGTCSDVCPTGALASGDTSWTWRAQVEQTCLALNAVSCRSCQDVCDPRAIRFQLETGGRATPRIDLATCTGCGACSTACPVDAVTFIRPVKQVSVAEGVAAS